MRQKLDQPFINEDKAIRITLRIALSDSDRRYVKRICLAEHYLKQEVHARARSMAYIVVREEGQMKGEEFCAEQSEYVGILVFGRMQSTRCAGWYGSQADVNAGWAKQTQWEMLSLMRCWLDPRVQRNGCWCIPKLASLVITLSLETISYDYLRIWPPAFLDQPWELREVISYCQSDRFLCHVYWFARFKLVRENNQGLRTYAHPLSALTDGQRQDIRDASRWNTAARKKRNTALASATIVHEVLLRKNLKYACLG